jgi:hypothetical protein
MVWNKGLINDPRSKGGRPKSSISYVGQTYGMLTILKQYNNKKSIYFTCKCECGSIKEIRKDAIIGPRAETKSCGCYLKEHGNGKRGQYDARGYLLSAARYRATERGMEFTITKEDIVIPDKCPLLGIDIIPKAKDRRHSPSLDRIDSTKGYTPDNIWVVSSRANTLKNDASLQELQTLVENLQKL